MLLCFLGEERVATHLSGPSNPRRAQQPGSGSGEFQLLMYHVSSSLFHQTTTQALKSFYRYSILTEPDTSHTLLAASSARSSPPVRAAHPSQTASTLDPSFSPTPCSNCVNLAWYDDTSFANYHQFSAHSATILNTDTALYWKSCWIRSCTACTASRHPPQYR